MLSIHIVVPTLNLLETGTNHRSLDQSISRSLTFLVHRGLEALSQSTGATLVAMRLVHRTPAVLVRLAATRVDAVAMDAALKEPRAACARWITFNR